MLDATDLNAIGRQLRKVYDERPKGGIPDQIWQLLLDLERRIEAGAGGPARAADRSRSRPS